MSDEITIEYDYQSTISFVNSLQAICGLMGGFVFTGIIVFLTTVGDPSTLLSQIALFTLTQAMGMFMMAMFELNYMNILVCTKSSKPIIPNYPARWRIINTFIILGCLFEMVSVHLMFLLKNLIILFVSSTCISAFGMAWMNIRWKYVEARMRKSFVRDALEKSR